MDYNLIKLVIVFAIIVAIIWAKKPLHWAFIAGIIATALICMIPVDQCGKVIWSVVTDWGKMAIVLDIYLITFLQRLLDQRKQIQLAQVDMINLFNNRIVNALLILIIIGFLPSPAAHPQLCGRNASAGDRPVCCRLFCIFKKASDKNRYGDHGHEERGGHRLVQTYLVSGSDHGSDHGRGTVGRDFHRHRSAAVLYRL